MNWVHHIPKIELHVHLEGAIPIHALWTLMEKYGGDPKIKSIEELHAKFVYTDFPHFIDTWVWKNQFLREYEDFTYIAEEVAKDFVRQNIIYAEMFHSPSDFYKY
ncbi:MAG: adenosine deaminase, partial [Simkaniaceae bacterium]|nr:adenosine deaminase [Simkaniaceae bacterium]